ncbi:chitin synthase-domain-containing protein [Whalleya microplaca]|nr:chitin synthase-domain-containing protein [Whalleya microplaca]
MNMGDYYDSSSDWDVFETSRFVPTPPTQASEIGATFSGDSLATSPEEGGTTHRGPRPTRPPRPDESFTAPRITGYSEPQIAARPANVVPGWSVSVRDMSVHGVSRFSPRRYELLTPPHPLSQRALVPQGPIRQIFEASMQPPAFKRGKPSIVVNVKVDNDLIEKGNRKVAFHKYVVISVLVTINSVLIFTTWKWPEHHYAYVPVVILPFVLNCIMIVNVLAWHLQNLAETPKQIRPPSPESMVMLMPCYNESPEECIKSLDSLVNQVGIDQHKKAILVICDGRVRGHGMVKTTAEYLSEDILVDRSHRKTIAKAYTGWDGRQVGIEIFNGRYKGIPYFCIIKAQNQGKRDSLIICRTLLHNFNERANRQLISFHPRLFMRMNQFLREDAKMDHVELLIGMDANTVFGADTIYRLVEESHYPGTLGVGGSIAVDFSHGNWNFWSLYQSAEYNISQGLRRLHQSVVTHKVNYLPGCCQLLRVCEETCGDDLLRKFGYYPLPADGLMKRILACASEDNNHTCMMLMGSKEIRTRQALKAYAYTDVPRSLPVFLCQRRRWSLGELANDVMLLLKAPSSFSIWERFQALTDILVWSLNPFIMAGLVCTVYTLMYQPHWAIITTLCVMLVPLCYHISMAIWLSLNMLERCQFLLGLALFTVCSPFMNIVVMIYACINMDNFGWGKTRKVVTEKKMRITTSEHAPEMYGYGTMAGGNNSVQTTSFPNPVQNRAKSSQVEFVAAQRRHARRDRLPII